MSCARKEKLKCTPIVLKYNEEDSKSATSAANSQTHGILKHATGQTTTPPMRRKHLTKTRATLVPPDELINLPSTTSKESFDSQSSTAELSKIFHAHAVAKEETAHPHFADSNFSIPFVAQASLAPPYLYPLGKRASIAASSPSKLLERDNKLRLTSKLETLHEADIKGVSSHESLKTAKEDDQQYLAYLHTLKNRLEDESKVANVHEQNKLNQITSPLDDDQHEMSKRSAHNRERRGSFKTQMIDTGKLTLERRRTIADPGRFLD